MTFSADYIRTSLQSLYGVSVTAADIRAWCAMNGTNYQTVSNKLSQYKTARGRWNLEVTQDRVEEIERSYQHLLLSLLCNKILFLIKMIPSSSLVILTILKKLFSPVSSIQRSLRVFRVMVKRSVWSKLVPN